MKKIRKKQDLASRLRARRKAKEEAQTLQRMRQAQDYRDAHKAAELPEEYLVATAIQADGKVHAAGKAHWETRAAMGREDFYHGKPGDIEGFTTNKDRFVDRRMARGIAIRAGQLPDYFDREPLSSDIRWLD